MTALRTRWREAVLVVVAYVPLLLTRPGAVNADIKQYLHLDAGELIAGAPELWNPDFGLGTVTHQYIGYLFPVGPFFWLGQTLGLADWVVQRLWYGSILVVAGLGMLALLRRVAPDVATGRPAQLAGALCYMLSPYLLGHLTRQSALLLPYAVFPWLVLAMAAAVASGGWRWPAVFALLVTVAGSMNGSSIFFVVLGAVLWAPVAACTDDRVGWRSAAGAVVRAAVLTFTTQLWWMLALAVGGGHGLPILSLTETLRATNATTTSFEILRGLGYWFFYGHDSEGLWLNGLAGAYMERLPLLLLSFGVAGVGLVGAAVVRWRHRAYFTVVTAVGLVLAVGSFWYAGRSLYGYLFDRAVGSSDLVFSLRNTQRAAPLVVLGLAAFTAMGLQALAAHRPRLGHLAAGVVIVAAAANLPALWTGGLVADRFHREEVPAYWTEAADHLDAGHPDQRVLEVPGSDFASYRWGHTLDPVTPGLMDRPFVARELLPHGDESGANLLVALDRGIQEGWFEPEALAPLARLLGVGDVVLRSDLEYERYRTARPRPLWAQLAEPPAGLSAPVAFGVPTPNVANPDRPMIDEVELGIPVDAEHPPPVAVFPVDEPLGLVRVRPSTGALVVSGDGEGLVALAAAGLLDVDGGVVRYAGSGAPSPGERLVLTDTDRERAERWYSLNANVGFTEPAGQRWLVDDVSDARIRPVEGAPATVTEYRAATAEGPIGAAAVVATGYGNRITLNPEFRPVNAFDGDPLTDWRVDEYGEPVTPRLELALEQAVSTDRIVFVQPQVGPQERRVRRLTVAFDGAEPFEVVLDERSYGVDGQVVEIAPTEFRQVAFEFVDGVGTPAMSGFAEIDIGVTVDEVVRVPADLLAGVDDLDHELAVVVTRQRTNPAEPVRPDPERTIVRAVELPSERGFTLTGTARLSDWAPDEVLDALLGVDGPDDPVARSSDRLAGDLRARALAAVDGDPSTHWSPEFLDQVGQWVAYDLPAPLTVQRLGVTVLVDGHHSLPTSLWVAGDDSSVLVDLVVPEGSDGPVTVPVTLPEPVTGSTITVTVAAVDERETHNWYSGGDVVLPVAIVDLGIPGLAAPVLADRIDTGCRDDLLTVDGTPVAVRVTGSVADALDGRGLALEACHDLALSAGSHEVRTADGRHTGLQVDRLVLLSGAGGVPASGWAETAVVEPPAVDVDAGRTSLSATFTGDGGPFWLVLGQSFDEGWRASIDGTDLGAPDLVDGFANGWLVPAGGAGEHEVAFTWTPQGAVWRGLFVSAVALLGCLVLTLRRRPAGWSWVEAPVLVDPRSPGVSLGQRPAMAAAVAMAALGAVLSRPWVGVVLGAVTWWTATRPSWRVLRVLLPLATFGTGVAYIVFLQVRWGYEPSFSWPSWGRSVHHIGLLAVLTILADVVVAHLGERDRR